MPAVKLYECFCWASSTPTAFIRQAPRLFFLPTASQTLFYFSPLENSSFIFHHLSLARVFLESLFWPNKYGENNAFRQIFLNPLHTLPFLPFSLPPPLCLPSLSFTLFSLSLHTPHPSPPLPPARIPQLHHNTVNRRAPADLQPSSFHWPPAWQARFNAASSLAEVGQVNLRVRCDLMPPAFEVSYGSVAYRTQKRCQVAIVKILSLKGGVALEYNGLDVMTEGTFSQARWRSSRKWRVFSRKCFALFCTDVAVLQKMNQFKKKNYGLPNNSGINAAFWYISFIHFFQMWYFLFAVQLLPSFSLRLITRTPSDCGSEKIRSKSRMHGIADHRQPSAKVTLASDCRVLSEGPSVRAML